MVKTSWVPWSNPPLVVYHGTLDSHLSSIIAGIKLSVGDEDSDFGQGFYTTTSLDQAKCFAKHVLRRSKDKSGRPAVIEFTLDRNALAQLQSLWFVLCTDDYWTLVESCRRLGMTNRSPGNCYDIVVGPVAKSYRMRSTYPTYDQISFHTDTAVALLNACQRQRVY